MLINVFQNTEIHPVATLCVDWELTVTYLARSKHLSCVQKVNASRVLTQHPTWAKGARLELSVPNGGQHHPPGKKPQ